ncbi:MAG: hypothetical protein WAS33_24865 [Candidatus Promineifilaceae bacterium]
MNTKIIRTAILAVFFFLGLAACGGAEPAPTTTAAPAATAVSATDSPTEPSATPAPATAEPVEPVDGPTNTPETEPTAAATAVATQPISYTITIDSPQPNQPLTAAREFTFSGSISPVPSQRLEIELAANGSSNGDNLLLFAEVDPATGRWSATSPIPPRRTGPATLHVRVAGVDATVPVTLQLAEDETATIVTVNQPLPGDIAVAGQTLLISGESRNLIDGNIQVGLFGCPADTDENLVANIEFAAGNGTWRAQIIVPETAVANCNTARLRVTTGGLTSSDPSVAWASDQLLTLVSPGDERANLFTVWEPTQLRFVTGQERVVRGTAVNPVDGIVLVELLQNEQVIASATAAPDLFGYWETSLTPPADAELTELQLRLSTGSGDTYRETLFPAKLDS